MFTESVQIKGDLKIEVFDLNGNIKDTRSVKNLVVTTGKAFIASRMSSNTAVVMSHMALGTSNTAPVVGNTGLGTEVGRVAIDSATTVGPTTTYIGTFPAGTGTGTIVEAGIFNAGSSGTMLCRTNFNAVNKGAADTIVITWNVTVS